MFNTLNKSNDAYKAKRDDAIGCMLSFMKIINKLVTTKDDDMDIINNMAKYYNVRYGMEKYMFPKFRNKTDR